MKKNRAGGFTVVGIAWTEEHSLISGKRAVI